MKFSCGRCGKRYATAETPAPGRVYKIRCKACGHVMVVKAPAAGSEGAPGEVRPAQTVVPAAAPPSPPPPGTAPPRATPPPPVTPPPRATPPATPPPLAAPPPTPYVDLFADARGEPTAPVPAGEGARGEDALSAAARASLPDGYGRASPAPDPLASLETPPPEPLPGPSPAAKVPEIARPAPKKSSGPLLLIAIGALVLVGILAFVLLGGQAASSPPPQGGGRGAAAPPSAAAPATPPAAAPGPAPAAAPPGPAAAAAEGDPLPDGLGQEQVQRVLTSNRRALEACIVEAGKAGAVKLDGRRVMLRLNIEPGGAVTSPLLDDEALDGTELGACLKGVARAMAFPRFRGDPMHVEVPLVLARGR